MLILRGKLHMSGLPRPLLVIMSLISVRPHKYDLFTSYHGCDANILRGQFSKVTFNHNSHYRRVAAHNLC